MRALKPAWSQHTQMDTVNTNVHVCPLLRALICITVYSVGGTMLSFVMHREMETVAKAPGAHSLKPFDHETNVFFPDERRVAPVGWWAACIVMISTQLSSAAAQWTSNNRF